MSKILLFKGFLGFLVSLPLLFSSVGNAQAYDWAKNKWKKIDDKEGITVYRKEFKDSPVKGVAGSALVDAPPSKIIWVLMDHDHKSDWIDKFSKAYTIDNPTPMRSIQYAAFDMPLFIDDRDFVYQYDFSYDKIMGAIIVDIKSVEHPSAPPSKTIGVRGEVLEGRYRLYPRDGGSKTFVEVEYLADPKGSLPKWLVNLVQKSWPYKTLKGLRTQVKKPFVKDHPIVTEGLKGMVSNGS